MRSDSSHKDRIDFPDRWCGNASAYLRFSIDPETLDK